MPFGLRNKEIISFFRQNFWGRVKEQRGQISRWRNEQEVKKQQILIVNGGEQEVNVLRAGSLLSALHV